MPGTLRTNAVLLVWAALVMVAGAGLMSWHQPFRDPDVAGVNKLVGRQQQPWRLIHVLSGSCSCSQRVMRDILSRESQQQTEEEILIVDDGVGYLRDSEALLPTLKLPIHHVTAEEMQTSTGLVGVPMLLITRADGTIAYAGGYGEGSHQDVRILKELQGGRGVSKKTVVGCAVDKRLKKRMDPFHLKYETVAQSAMAR